MPAEDVDFRLKLSRAPGLESLPREKSVKAVYLRDRRALPEAFKKLFDSVNVLRIPVDDPEDISRAIAVANGEVASVSLGLKADTLQYVRSRLEMLRDRELSVDWGPREDPYDGEVLPHLDGFQLDLSSLSAVEVDGENGTVRCEAGARWKDVFDLCRSKGWIFPVFPVLPINPYMGDIIGGTAALASYAGGPGRYLRNVDFLAPDARYGQSGFDLVPNAAAGYDLNSLMLVMGRHVSIPASMTFSLLCSAEDCRTFRYTLESAEEMLEILKGVSRTRMQPLKVVFGDGTAAKVAFGKQGGPAVEVTLHGTEASLPVQEKALDSLFKEVMQKEELEGLVHPLQDEARRVPPAPLVEVRASIVDLKPLMEELLTWREAQGSHFGLVGSLFEDGTVSLLPFSEGPVSRGERFDRLLELTQVTRRHRCRLRNNPVLQLLSPESGVENRLALVRRIKARMDMPSVINPSGVLWLPQSR